MHPIEVHAFIEVEPGSFKPVEECSRDELDAYIMWAYGSSVMAAREAVANADRYGRNPVSEDLMDQATGWEAEAGALSAYRDATER